LKNWERIVTLTELGLTNNQARTYLALLQAGPTTAKELAKTSKIARPDIYRILPALEKEGLVEKLMTRPAIFEAIPPVYVLPTLLKHKTTKQYALKKKTEKLLSDLKNNHSKKEVSGGDTEFTIVPGKEVIVQRLKSSILESQMSVCVVTSSKRFSAAILEFVNAYQEALEKGVKIRIATDYHAATATALKVLQTLLKDTRFEVRYFDAPPAAIVSIFDNKEAFVSMSPTAQLAEAPAIWSNNLSFIALAQDYFENKWKNATNTNIT